MAIQKLFIAKNRDLFDVEVANSDVYQTIHGSPGQIAEVLSAIYFQRVSGWWHYQQPLVDTYKICTRDEFTAQLRKEV